MATVNDIKDQLGSVIEMLDKLEHQEQSGELPYNVIHLKNNPHQMVMKAKDQELADLKKENDRLRARLSLLESGNDADITRRIDDAIDNAKQIEILTGKLAEMKKREDKILDSFRKISREFREVCYLLTGYRVDALKGSIYRLSHMYAESEEDKLFFEIAPEGSIQLLKNGYSDRLSEQISLYLESADSFPAFLASITLDLFKSSTQLTPMSMCMSTTIQPKP